MAKMTKEEIVNRLESGDKMMYLERIFQKYLVAENGCWIWQGYTDPEGGYGQIRLYGVKTVKVHRFVAYVCHGLNLFDPSLDAAHDCDTRNCVNPNHIAIATRSENLQNSSDKGRWHGGGKSGPDSVTNYLPQRDWGKYRKQS